MQTGIYATAATRAPKDMRGLTFPVELEIVDRLISPEERANAGKDADKSMVEFAKPNAPYSIKVLLTVRHPHIDLTRCDRVSVLQPCAACSSVLWRTYA